MKWIYDLNNNNNNNNKVKINTLQDQNPALSGGKNNL